MSRKEKIQEDKGIIKFTNGMLFGFQNNQVLSKLAQSKLGSKAKFDIYKLIRKIGESPEMKALQDSIKEINENHEKEQIDKEEKEVLLITDPEIVELFNIESGLETKKITIKAESLSDDITISDMLQVSWLIDFEEE